MKWDEEAAMLRDSLLICALFWAAILSLVFLSACTPTVKHEVPQLDQFAGVSKKIADSLKACPTLAMPPIPQECVIDIRGDTMTASSKECESLIRHYVAARRLLRSDAPKSTTPTATP